MMARGVTNYGVLPTALPLRQAALQMAPGWMAENGPKPYGYHADVAPSLRSVPRGVDDLTGRRFGRFVVAGLSDKTWTWAVRCDCGLFETRREKTLLTPKHADRFQCQRCDYIRHIRRREVFDRTGKWPADNLA